MVYIREKWQYVLYNDPCQKKLKGFVYIFNLLPLPIACRILKGALSDVEFIFNSFPSFEHNIVTTYLMNVFPTLYTLQWQK